MEASVSTLGLVSTSGMPSPRHDMAVTLNITCCGQKIYVQLKLARVTDQLELLDIVAAMVLKSTADTSSTSPQERCIAVQEAIAEVKRRAMKADRVRAQSGSRPLAQVQTLKEEDETDLLQLAEPFAGSSSKLSLPWNRVLMWQRSRCSVHPSTANPQSNWCNSSSTSEANQASFDALVTTDGARSQARDARRKTRLSSVRADP